MSGFTQSLKGFESTPKNMVFVPSGSFIMMIEEQNEVHEVTVSVDAFWMSDEITNAEYREFVNYVRNNPEKEICWVDLVSAAKNRNINGLKGGIGKYLICVKNSEIIDHLIDKIKMPHPEYFNNRKYNKHPVVGVSQENARYYCIWRTQLENEKHESEGEPLVHDYRLPIEAEWAYVGSHTEIKNNKKAESKINPSKSGKKNDFGLRNFAGNVSEWTSSTPKIRWSTGASEPENKDTKIYRGGSWKTNLDTEKRNELDQCEAENYIGFRIVRSYLNK